MKLVIFLPTFNALCMRQRFDVMSERENILGSERALKGLHGQSGAYHDSLSAYQKATQKQINAAAAALPVS
jgi:hypothetical protein